MKNSLINNLKALFEWSKMPIEQRYNVVLAFGIIGLVAIIAIQQNYINKKRMECKDEQILLQNRIDEIKDNHLHYLQTMDAEYRELLKLLNKIN